MAQKLTLPEMQDLRDLLAKYYLSQDRMDQIGIEEAIDIFSKHLNKSIEDGLYGVDE